MNIHPRLLLAAYEGTRCLVRRYTAESETSTELAGARWTTRLVRQPQTDDAELWIAEARVTHGTARACTAGIAVTITGWSRDHYLLLPGVIYAGNRFEVRKLPYPPKHAAPDCRTDVPTLIADIPRLNYAAGPSRIQLLAGALSRPAAGVFDPRTQTGWLLLCPSQTEASELGFDFEENADRTAAELRVTVPGVRERRYEHMNADADARDRARDFAAGDTVVLSVKCYRFSAGSVQELFDRLFWRRRELLPEPTPPTELPAAVAFELIEDHYNRDFWWEEAGLYRTAVGGGWGDNPYQTGWCGGIIAEYALLAAGRGSLTRQRARDHLDRALTDGIAPSGLFYGKFNHGAWRSDCDRDTEHPWRKTFTLVRRQGDALLYALRAIALLEQRREPLPATWLAGTRAVANALVKMWRRHGQFGQWVDQFSGEVCVGNSASGAIMPAALVAAWRRFGDAAMLAVAEESATHFFEQFTRRGLTTGGPGDALQCPDSESSYALVESFVALWEATGQDMWLERAGAATRQFASWVMPYDYRFAPETLFGRLGIRSAGAVFANAQNGHGAPGICTHSGLGLFKLFRATGERQYLDLVGEIARALPQYVSRADRPMVAFDGRVLPPGWLNERCNTSDWDNNPGGVFYGPCWPEVSLLLSAVELPGIYAQPDTGLLCCFDNLHVEWADHQRTGLRVHNPTPFPAQTLLSVETSTAARLALAANHADVLPLATIPATATIEVPVRV